MARKPFASLLLVVGALMLAACGTGGIGSAKPSSPGSQVPPATPPDPTASEIAFAQDVFDLVNDERTSRGLAPLLWDDGCARAAFDHSFDMGDRGFLDHVNPEGEGPDMRMLRHGVLFNAWGENIAAGQPTPADVMAAWMISPGHRDNILNPAFHRLGVGCYQGGGGPWWTQDFVD